VIVTPPHIDAPLRRPRTASGTQYCPERVADARLPRGGNHAQERRVAQNLRPGAVRLPSFGRGAVRTVPAGLADLGARRSGRGVPDGNPDQ
jgi:hypothetical protein